MANGDFFYRCAGTIGYAYGKKGGLLSHTT